MNLLESMELNELIPSVEGLTVTDFEYLRNTEGLAPGQWKELSPNERLDTLRTLESKLAEIQGRPPVNVCESEMPGKNGFYDPQTRIIALNAEQLKDSTQCYQLVNTIAHEGRHAYQHYAIEHPGFHPNEQEVTKWRKNFHDYLNVEQYGGLYYRLQPIEADAWKYGQLVEETLRFSYRSGKKA